MSYRLNGAAFSHQPSGLMLNQRQFLAKGERSSVPLAPARPVAALRPVVSISWTSVLLLLAGCAPQSNGDVQVATGMRLYEQRQFAEAITELEEALNKPLQDHTRSDVLTAIGNCYNKLDRFEEALTYHDRALQEDPNNYHAYVNKGIVYRLMGDYDQAATWYTKALELAPEYAELNASMGALAIYQGDYQTAISHLERAIELDDALAVAHSNLALAYATVGRFDEADDELKKAVVRGYHQPEVIRQRIEQLRKLSGGSE